MLKIIGAAVGSGGRTMNAARGPDIIHDSVYWKDAFTHEKSPVQWGKIFREKLIPNVIDLNHSNKLNILSELFTDLAAETKQLVQEKQRFCVIGGDHSAAIGTWSGAFAGLKGPLGLIWVDAHADAHTFETTPSGNVHGMPVAALLGYGDDCLTQLAHTDPKILPENLCLIGIRSFEPEEHALLTQLNVKIYDMEAINRLGMTQVLKEAQAHVSKNTVGYGITIDIDGIDPEDAPAVGTPEPGGIRADDLLKALAEIHPDPKQIGFELMEFNPSQDINQKTEKLMINIIKTLL